MIVKNYSAAVVENYKIYSREELVNEINGIINSNKFGRFVLRRITWDIEYVAVIVNKIKTP